MLGVKIVLVISVLNMIFLLTEVGINIVGPAMP